MSLSGWLNSKIQDAIQSACATNRKSTEKLKRYHFRKILMMFIWFGHTVWMRPGSR